MERFKAVVMQHTYVLSVFVASHGLWGSSRGELWERVQKWKVLQAHDTHHWREARARVPEHSPGCQLTCWALLGQDVRNTECHRWVAGLRPMYAGVLWIFSVPWIYGAWYMSDGSCMFSALWTCHISWSFQLFQSQLSILLLLLSRFSHVWLCATP